MSAILKLVQGTEAWHDHRRSCRNASETAAVMGISPWLSAYRLWLIKTRRFIQPINSAMQHGAEIEPQARLAYELTTGNLVQPLVMQQGEYSASLDGITFEEDLIVEIKCPMRGRRSDLWAEAAAGLVPEHYRVQVQHQLMVSGARLAHLWVFDGTNGLLVEIARDDVAMARIRQAWDAFQVFLDADRAPPLIEEDTLLRDDFAWLEAAQSYVRLKEAYDGTAANLDAAKVALLALANAPRQEGGGVQVTRFAKQGNVDYKQVPVLRGVDLDQFRSPAREEVRITLMKVSDKRQPNGN